tara:strand:+ start:544 stop:1404 length:861 start_codon:yes stop_codon:yes gene_type:complete
MELKLTFQKLKEKFINLNILEKIIFLNLACFIFPYILNTFFFLFDYSNFSIISWFELSSDLKKIIFKPWSIISYSFFHSGFFHLFWNMIILLYSGQIFLNLFPNKMFLSTYFVGVIFGGIIFIFCYNVFPVFFNSYSTMIGSSAGVMAILIFICVYSPNYEIRILFFNIKLLYIGLFFIFFDIIQIPYGNAGGHFAHLGGSLVGFIYARQIKNGKDIFDSFSFLIISIFYKNKKKENKIIKNDYRNILHKDINQKKIDQILDKINSSGYDSLSKEEKDFLFKNREN